MDNYINHVLACYFSDDSELSEDDAIATLKRDMINSSELRNNLWDELQKAFADVHYPWQKLFIDYDVFHFENNDDASLYARNIFMKKLFYS